VKHIISYVLHTAGACYPFGSDLLPLCAEKPSRRPTGGSGVWTLAVPVEPGRVKFHVPVLENQLLLKQTVIGDFG
jgi:hypothetical protein